MMMGNNDSISRQAAIDEAEEWIEAVYCGHDEQRERDAIKHVINGIKKLPSAQPDLSSYSDKLWKAAYERGKKEAQDEIYWGYTPTPERPLADVEIVSRLRTIQKQIGGSYAIDRAIELIEAVQKQPEIIRCKDCKHRDPEDKRCDCGHDILWQLPRDDNWFCADSERKPNG